VKLALGTAQFGMPYGITNRTGQLTQAQTADVLSLAYAQGFSVLDTAMAYGDAEASLGHTGVEHFQVVTKLSHIPLALPAEMTDAGAWAKGQFAASLKRLGLPCVYGLLLHRPGDLLGEHGKDLLRAMQELQDQGLVKKLGFSVYSPNELEPLLKLAQWDLVQAPLNLIDRRLQTSGWLHRLKDSGVEVHTRSAFLQGLLLTHPSALPSQFAPWSGLWRAWDQWQLDTGCSALAACLAYPQSFPEVDKVVVGVSGLDDLRQILALLNAPAPELWPYIDSDAEKLINPSQWAAH
jgi:aryl-alcohol dehydrogenase-like predicted oxidoreductase